MKRIIVLFAVALAVQSCNKDEPKPLTKEEIAQQIDSIARQRIKEVEKEAKKELEYRMKIEVKIHADSIVNIMMQGSDSIRKPDSAK